MPPAPVLTSCPLPRFDQIAAELAVASGVQDRNACGETPSTLALWPLTLTFPPSTGSSRLDPAQLRDRGQLRGGDAARHGGDEVGHVKLLPLGIPVRAGCRRRLRGRLPGAATPGGGFRVKPKGSPAGPVRAPAGTAKPASVTPAVAVTANSWAIRHQGPVQAARAARRWDRGSTMYKTI